MDLHFIMELGEPGNSSVGGNGFGSVTCEFLPPLLFASYVVSC
jgi:hypothetical protein